MTKHKFILSGLEAGSLKSVCLQSQAPSKGSRGKSFSHLPASWVLLSVPWLVAAYLLPQSSNGLFFSSKDTHHPGFKAHSNAGWFPFKKYFIIYLFVWLLWVLVAAPWIFDLQLQHVGSSVAARGTFTCSMWDLVPWSVTEPRPAALRAQSSATGPPGKSPEQFHLEILTWSYLICKELFFQMSSRSQVRIWAYLLGGYSSTHYSYHIYKPGLITPTWAGCYWDLR